MPHTAAGWRIEPPVSVPVANGASNAATAAAEPPEDPPGTRLRSQGLCDGPNAEFSVDDPIANSSMFVLPSGMAPASRSLRVTVDSYGGCQRSRIRDPQVVGISTVVKTSLTATGTPASGPSGWPVARAASTARAAASATSADTCRNACTWPSTAAILSRCAWVTSVADTSPAATADASSAAVRDVSSAVISVLCQDPGDPEPLVLDGGRGRERGLRAQAGDDLVGTEHVGERHRVRRRRDAFRGHFLDPGDRRDDHVELRREVIELRILERQPGQVGQVGHLVTGDGHAGHPRCPHA